MGRRLWIPGQPLTETIGVSVSVAEKKLIKELKGDLSMSGYIRQKLGLDGGFEPDRPEFTAIHQQYDEEAIKAGRD